MSKKKEYAKKKSHRLVLELALDVASGRWALQHACFRARVRMCYKAQQLGEAIIRAHRKASDLRFHDTYLHCDSFLVYAAESCTISIT